MNTRKYMFKNSLVACFACCCISFASAGNPPFFPTDVVANAKGELLMTDKGVKRVDVFSPDGKTLLRSFPMDEAPTGILLDGDKAYVTTFGTTGHLQIDRHIHFRIMSLGTGTMQKQETTVFPYTYPITVRQVFQYPISPIHISGSIRFIIHTQLVKSRSRNGGRRYITRLVRYSWSIIIPIRYQIVRQCRIGKNIRGNNLSRSIPYLSKSMYNSISSASFFCASVNSTARWR